MISSEMLPSEKTYLLPSGETAHTLHSVENRQFFRFCRRKRHIARALVRELLNKANALNRPTISRFAR